jgi:serine protease Do
MRYWTQFRGVILVLLVGVVFGLVGMIIGSNISIPDKLKAEPQRPVRGNVPVDVTPTTGHSPFVAIAEEVRPAVVNISAESVTEDRFHNFMNDDFFRRFFGMPPGQLPNQPRMRRSESLGSGFIISPDGYVLTNNHVVEGAEKVTVTLPDKRSFKADIVGSDKETDVAVLKISAGDDLPTIPLGNSDSILVGDWVMAVGNPFPNLGLDRTVTVGVVSAKGRQGLSFGGTDENPSYQNYIQTDASINPGNSGGPLVNLQGEVIGINSAIATPTGGNVGIGFAIPINMAKDVSDQLIKTGKVSRGYLGIYPQDITEDLKNANSLPSTEGVLVAQVDKDTPAERGGLKVGDVITNLDETKVTDAQQFRFLVAKAGPGATIKLKVWRNGTLKDISVKLGNRTEFVNLNGQQPKGEKQQDRWLGLTVQTLAEDNASQFGVEYTPGVIITAVEPGSPADDAGLGTGDIILKIGGKDVETADDFYKIAGSLKKSAKPVSFYIRRGQANIFVAVTPEQ